MAGPPWMQPRLFHLELERDSASPPQFIRDKRREIKTADKAELLAMIVDFMMTHEGHFKCVGRLAKSNDTVWEFRYAHIFGPNQFVVHCGLQPNEPLLQVLCAEETNPSNRISLSIDPSKFVKDSLDSSIVGGLTWTTALKGSDLLARDIKENILNSLIENMEPYDIDLEVVSPNPSEVAA